MPNKMDLNLVSIELTTNYISIIYPFRFLLLHFISSSSPTSLVFISSGLALIPVSRCAGDCASKAALHHLILCLRDQLRDIDIKVFGIIPPAVKTELHNEKNQTHWKGPRIGMGLEDFTTQAWKGLLAGRVDIPVGMVEQVYEAFKEAMDV